MSDNTLRRVEQACADLVDRGKPVTFTAVATATGLGRSTLYRNQGLRALIDEHRGHQTQDHTLISEIAHLRTALETVAATVKKHEERIRKLERRPTTNSA
jgi:Family of unknown function (DUF6262)